MSRLSKNPWWIVLFSVIGLSIASSPVGLFTFGIFLKPITHEFGWTRGTVASAMIVSHLFTAVGAPVAGKMMDRWGIRRVMIPLTVVYALATALISQTPAAPLAFVMLYGLWGAMAAGQGPVPFGKAISGWFEARRGLALGIGISGIGLGGAVIPQLTRVLITHFGWRHAYIGLGAVVLILGLPAYAVIGRQPPQRAGSSSAAFTSHHASDPTAPGMTLGEAVRDYRFWVMGLTSFLVGSATQGTAQHVVPLLTDRGFSVALATSVFSMVGLAMIVGRVLGGFLLDRIFAPYVAAGFFAIPLAGIAILSSGMRGPVPFFGTFLLGLGMGAEIGVLAFMVGRYFGLRAYAHIYGYQMMMFMFGAGFGPWVMGYCFDKTHSYGLAQMVFSLVLIFSAILITRLGPYVYPEVARGQVAVAHAGKS